MSEHKHEMISALMDGEADHASDRAIDALARDPALRGMWGRFHLISDCLKNDVGSHFDCGLADRIERALSDEPTVLAPDAWLRHRILKPVAGLAIAASVAALAVISVQQTRTEAPVPAAGQQVAQQTADSPLQAYHQFTLASDHEASTSPQVRLTSVRSDPRLNSYLVNHTEYRSHGAVQGMFPYVRIVAHESDE